MQQRDSKHAELVIEDSKILGEARTNDLSNMKTSQNVEEKM